MKKFKILILIIFIGFFLFYLFSFLTEQMQDLYYAQIIYSIDKRHIVVPEKNNLPKIEIEAEAFLVKRISSQGKERILLQENIDKGVPIASITKLMTAAVTIDNLSKTDYNLNSVIQIPEEIKKELSPYFLNVLIADQEKTIQDFLELALVYSNNDAALILAELFEKEDFIQQMNEKTNQIGLKNTYFINVTGLDPENHHITNYSTARDLARMTQHIISNYPLIIETSLKNKVYGTLNGLSSLYLNPNQELLGGKTGYTLKAGGCLLTILKNEKNQTFINIVLGAESSVKRVEEMQKIINWINLQ